MRGFLFTSNHEKMKSVVDHIFENQKILVRGEGLVIFHDEDVLLPSCFCNVCMRFLFHILLKM